MPLEPSLTAEGTYDFNVYALDRDGDEITIVDVWISDVDGLGEPADPRPEWLQYSLTDGASGSGESQKTISFSLARHKIPKTDGLYTISVTATDDLNSAVTDSFVLQLEDPTVYVALVTNRSSANEHTINKAALEAAGFVVTDLLYSDLDPAFDWSPYDVIVTARLKAATQSANIRPAIDAGVPCVLNMSAGFSGPTTDHYLVAMDLVESVRGISTSWNCRSEQIVDNTHPITDAYALDEIVALYTADKYMAGVETSYVGTKITSGDPSISFPDLAGDACMIVVEPGTLDLLGANLPGRIVMWGGLHNGGAGDYTIDGQDLLAEAVTWAIS